MKIPQPEAHTHPTTIGGRIWGMIGRQLRHPEGLSGSLIGRLMVMINDQPNRLALKALAAEPADKVLELGFGPGKSLQALVKAVPQGKLFGIDPSDRMLKQASRRNRGAIASGQMQLSRGICRPLAWPDGYFDKILLVNVIYFFDMAGEDLAEVRRVLRPGGTAVIYATDRATMAQWPFAGSDTHQTFDAPDLLRMLELAGFARAHVKISEVKLPFGICGLVATVKKPLEDRQADSRTGES